VIWVKGVSSYTPDYYVEMLPTSPWIHQPFEEYDNLRPEGLAKKFRSEASEPRCGLPPGNLPRASGSGLGKHEKGQHLRVGFFSTWCPGEDSNLHAVKR
jgi:hypothetical protein